MPSKSLRRGYSTGACAAAAAKGAALRLLGSQAGSVSLRLPWGDPSAPEVPFRLNAPELLRDPLGRPAATCGVVKDAGDDPDVTDGLEIRASVTWVEAPSSSGLTVSIEGGPGVGRVTKPGLAVPVGRPSITPVPLAMIESGVREVFAGRGGAVEVIVSVPRGEEVARKTLNARLGILGGLSILGSTGIVLPMSAHAWRATIDASLDVARAAGARSAVLAHGRSSEAAARQLLPELPPAAFVLMGDHVGYALEAAASRGLAILVVGQFAKFCKVAAGHFETHVRDSSLDLGTLADLLRRAGFSQQESERALAANTARQVYDTLRASGDRGLFRLLAQEVASGASRRVSAAVPVEALLFGYAKELLARVPVPSGSVG